MGNTKIFELCETSSKKKSRLCVLLGDRYGLLYLWRMFKNFAKNEGVGQEQFRRLINSRLCYQKEHHSRCQTWTFGTATNALPCQGKCCRKLVNPSMEDTNPHLRDGTKTTNTEVLCLSSGGPRSKWLNMTRCFGRPLQRRKPERIPKYQTMGTQVESRLCSNQPHSSWSTNWERDNWTTRSWNSWHSSRSGNSWFFLHLGSFSVPSKSMYRCAQCVSTSHCTV